MNTVPELGSGGWVTDPLKALDLIFAHALESDFSQSNVFHGRVTSIPFIIALHQTRPDNLSQELETALRNLFGRFFDSTNISVRYAEPDAYGKYVLTVGVSVTKNGIDYSLSTVISIKDGKVVEVLKELNK